MTLPLTENFRVKVISRGIAFVLLVWGTNLFWMAGTSLFGSLSSKSLFLLIFAVPFFIFSYFSLRGAYLMWTGQSVSAMNHLVCIVAVLVDIISVVLLDDLFGSLDKQHLHRLELLGQFFSLCAAGVGFCLIKYKLSLLLNIQMNEDCSRMASAWRTYFTWLAFFLWGSLGAAWFEYEKKTLQQGDDKIFLLGMIISLAVAIIFYYTCTSIFCRRPREED